MLPRIFSIRKKPEFKKLDHSKVKMSSSSVHKHYDIGEKLGEGGYGIVKKAVCKLNHQVVAMKIMKRDGMDQEAERSVRTEVAMLQSLRHPNIVKGYDFFEEKDSFYFVMEKVDGGELFDRIVKKSHYSEREARDLTKILLGAIDYLHAKRIAHRYVWLALCA